MGSPIGGLLERLVLGSWGWNVCGVGNFDGEAQERDDPPEVGKEWAKMNMRGWVEPLSWCMLTRREYVSE